jgi:hypothetical protein
MQMTYHASDPIVKIKDLTPILESTTIVKIKDLTPILESTTHQLGHASDVGPCTDCVTPA